MRTILALAALLLPVVASSALAKPTVDLSLEQQTTIPCKGNIALVDLVATSPHKLPQTMSAVSVIVEYPWKGATLLGIETADAGADWMVAGFLLDPDGINDDLEDGEVLLTLLAYPDVPAIAQTRCGTILATLVFEVDPDYRARIEIGAESGEFGVTAIYPPDEVGVEILGRVSGETVLCPAGRIAIDNRR